MSDPNYINQQTEVDYDALRQSMPTSGWVCFHCGEVLTTPGAARDHFGGEPNALAGCQIKVGEERGLLMELRKAQDEVKEWQRRALQAESENEMLEGRISSLTTAMQSYKPFRECRSINDVFFVYDSMEGRALAAEERLKNMAEAVTCSPEESSL